MWWSLQAGTFQADDRDTAKQVLYAYRHRNVRKSRNETACTLTKLLTPAMCCPVDSDNSGMHHTSSCLVRAMWRGS